MPRLPAIFLFLILPFAGLAADIQTLFEATPPDSRILAITGQVIVVTASSQCYVRDETGAICLQSKTVTPYQVGDIIAATGHVGHFQPGLPWFEACQITIIGKRPLPSPLPATAIEIIRGDRNGQVVRYGGVVTDVLIDDIDHDWCWVLIESFGDKVPVALPMPEGGVSTLTRLVDAEVSIIGMPTPDAGYRRFLKSRICLSSPSEITVIKPPPENPFDVEEFKNSASDQIRKVRRCEHRRRIAGRIVSSWRKRFLFVTSGRDQTILVDLGHECEIPPSGTPVIASGFLHLNAFHVRMDNAVIKTDPSAAMGTTIEPPIRSSAKPFAPHGNNPPSRSKPDTDPFHHGKLIRLTGLVKSISDRGTTAAMLYLDSNGTTIPVELGQLQPPELGSCVEVTGACIMSAENSSRSRDFVQLTGAALAPRDQDDIRVLSGPPWWTPTKFLILVGSMIVIFVILYLRNRQKQKQARLEAQLRIDERTKLAVELHDSLAQNLTGISLQLDAAEMAEGEDRAAALTYLSNAREALRSCREGLRYCLSDLRSRSFEDTDMTEAVTETVRPHIGKARLFVRFNVPRSRLSDSSAHAVLCIVRELAVNAVRHGHATEIHVAGEFRDGQIRFSVRDNGCGFDPDSRPGSAQGHFGLLGVNERISAFKGTLKIDSAIGKGTKATVILNIS